MTPISETSLPVSRPEQGNISASIFALVEDVFKIIDDAKAEDIIFLDLVGKTSLADAMLIASGTSDRHVGAIAERVIHAVKERGLPAPKVEGMPVCDWVLIDTGDIIVHLFRPEVRGFYNLEKLWGMGRPQEGVLALDDKPVKPKTERPKRIVTPKAGDDEKPKRAAQRPRAKAAAIRED